MTLPTGPVLAAVDWGTTNLRIWLMSETGAVLGERKSGEGMASAAGRFATILDGHLAAMGCPDGLPAIVCGMAGARQGWVEAGYLDLPARIEAFAAGSTEAPGASRQVCILPGLAQRGDAPDVMRGEETQIAGAGLDSGRHLVCMPGTHSKWVRVADGAVTGFQTAMTGELFHVLATQSILRHSLGEAPDAGPPSAQAFVSALRRMLDAPERLTSMLFGIRAGGLLAGLSPADAAATLSGLLIGAEIAGARARKDEAITLVASGAMAERYGVALDVAGLAFRPLDADEAVRRGLFAAGRRLYLTGGST